MSDLTLHNYFRSSTSFRVRVALNIKGLSFDYVSYHLRKGEQRSENFLKLNPQGLVPALEMPGTILTQSLRSLSTLMRPTLNHHYCLTIRWKKLGYAH